MIKYKKVRVVEDLRQVPIVLETSIVYVEKRSKKLKVLNSANFNLVLESKNKAYVVFFANKYLVCSSLQYYKDNQLCYCDENYDLYEFEGIYWKNFTIWKVVDDLNEKVSYFVFDLEKKEFIKSDFDFNAKPILFFEGGIVTMNESHLECKNVFNCRNLWQFDVAQFGTYKDIKMFADREPEERQREINRVYYYNNKIIVTLSRAIIAIEPEMGQLLWKIDTKNFNPYDIVFDHNTGYVGDGLSYVVADIEKGQIIYEREFDNTLRVNIEGSSLSHILYNNLTLHQNFLWFTYGTGGNRFLLKANPANGDIVDGMLLDTKLPTHPPVFDKNRMYLLDQDGNLYVYEKT